MFGFGKKTAVITQESHEGYVAYVVNGREIARSHKGAEALCEQNGYKPEFRGLDHTPFAKSKCDYCGGRETIVKRGETFCKGCGHPW